MCRMSRRRNLFLLASESLRVREIENPCQQAVVAERRSSEAVTEEMTIPGSGRSPDVDLHQDRAPGSKAGF